MFTITGIAGSPIGQAADLRRGVEIALDASLGDMNSRSAMLSKPLLMLSGGSR